MKLIIAGASGFIGSELVRQALLRPEISSVLALSRKTVSAPHGADGAKLKSLVVKDYDSYPIEVTKEFAGADACIWTVAILPQASRKDFEAARRVCLTYTMAGLRAMYDAGPAKPFRFLYMAGMTTERDQTKKPSYEAKYCLMRGEVENQVLAFASEHKDEIQACVAKPGPIVGPGYMMRNALFRTMNMVGFMPIIERETIVAAMLDQVVHGFEKEPLLHEDLERLGKKALQKT